MPSINKPMNHRCWWAAFFVAMTLLAIVVRWHVVQLNREVRREGLSSQIYIGTRSVLVDALDVETGLRGYLIVGGPEYLRPYHEGLGRLSDDLARLKGLTADVPTEWPHVQAAEQALDHVLAEFRDQVALGEDRGAVAARERFTRSPTKPTIDLIRDHLTAVQVEEVRKIEEATRKLDGQMTATLWLLNAYAALSGILCLSMVAGVVTSPTDRVGQAD